MTQVRKVNLAEGFAGIDAPWSPHIAAELNGQHVKIAKFEGAFDWHHHEREDEGFLVIKGQIEMGLRGRTVTLGEGEMIVIPAGVEHRPASAEGAWVLMFEPSSTRNTGEIETERTVENLPWTPAEEFE